MKITLKDVGVFCGGAVAGGAGVWGIPKLIKLITTKLLKKDGGSNEEVVVAGKEEGETEEDSKDDQHSEPEVIDTGQTQDDILEKREFDHVQYDKIVSMYKHPFENKLNDDYVIDIPDIPEIPSIDGITNPHEGISIENEPYQIDGDEFLNGKPLFNKMTVRYYIPDDVLCDEDGNIHSCPEACFGYMYKEHFDFSGGGEHIIYIRNGNEGADYEILKRAYRYKEDYPDGPIQ